MSGTVLGFIAFAVVFVTGFLWFRRIHAVSLPEDRRPDILDDLRTRLFEALVAAGDGAYDDRDWEDAVHFYERAQDLGTLSNTAARQLRRARDRM